MTAEEFAIAAGMTVQTVRKKCRQGRLLRCEQIDGRGEWRIHPASLRAFTWPRAGEDTRPTEILATAQLIESLPRPIVDHDLLAVLEVLDDAIRGLESSQR